jgi:SAM-dependent methyltransferase
MPYSSNVASWHFGLRYLRAALPIWSNKLVARLQPSRLDGGGERVDIFDPQGANGETALDMYQLSHLRRYQYACDQIIRNGITADLACGTGYGSALLARFSAEVYAFDLDRRTIAAATTRYRDVTNLHFAVADLLDLQFTSRFDNVVSFETIEHFAPDDIPRLLTLFTDSLKPDGKLIFSTPLEQQASPEALALDFHKTFGIDEATISRWLRECGLEPASLMYQSYSDHLISDARAGADFIICTATKPNR